MSEPQYLIEKRGLYYRPNAQGYTGLKREAGRYAFDEARARTHPNGESGPRDWMQMIAEDDAPEFSASCCWDVRLRETQRQRDLLTDVLRKVERILINRQPDKLLDGVALIREALKEEATS